MVLKKNLQRNHLSQPQQLHLDCHVGSEFSCDTSASVFSGRPLVLFKTYRKPSFPPSMTVKLQSVFCSGILIEQFVSCHFMLRFLLHALLQLILLIVTLIDNAQQRLYQIEKEYPRTAPFVLCVFVISDLLVISRCFIKNIL